MPVAPVSDALSGGFRRLAELLRDLLGGIEAYRFPEDDPVFVTLRFGDSELGIGAMGGAPIHGRPQRPAAGHRIELCLYVDDVDATAARRAPTVVPEPRTCRGASGSPTSRTPTATS